MQRRVLRINNRRGPNPNPPKPIVNSGVPVGLLRSPRQPTWTKLLHWQESSIVRACSSLRPQPLPVLSAGKPSFAWAPPLGVPCGWQVVVVVPQLRSTPPRRPTSPRIPTLRQAPPQTTNWRLTCGLLARAAPPWMSFCNVMRRKLATEPKRTPLAHSRRATLRLPRKRTSPPVTN